MEKFKSQTYGENQIRFESFWKVKAKLDLRTGLKIAHKVSNKTEIKWEESIEVYREFKKFEKKIPLDVAYMT